MKRSAGGEICRRFFIAVHDVRVAPHNTNMRGPELTSIFAGRTQSASFRHGAARMIRVNRETMTICPNTFTAAPTALSGGVVAASVREENAL
jgi:hypothetical protein